MREKQRAIVLCLLLFLGTLGLFWPAIHFDFINYDDPDYVTNNGAVQRGLTAHGVGWAFTTFRAGNWHPVTWLSHMVDAAIYGPHPWGHHLTSILLHSANVVLLFLMLWLWTGVQWRSALVAGLFAVHPLRVESVAWISERKDVLCAFFWLLTMLAYRRYAQQPGRKRRVWYFLVLGLFVLGLLSKPMIVTLPVLLLALDLWPLKRMPTPRIFLEKIPFLFLVGIDCILTIRAQHASNSVVTLQNLPLHSRLANALVSYVLYLGKIIWPVDLAVPYPFSHSWTFWQAAGAGLLLLLCTVLVSVKIFRQPALFVGWFWFLVTLLPVIGLVQVGSQLMADRYTYMPSIGIFLMLVWAIPETWLERSGTGMVVTASVTAVLASLMVATARQLGYWSDSVTLFTHTIAVTGDNILAEYNLGEALTRRGDKDAAIVHYQRALSIHPSPVEAQSAPITPAHFNLGLIYLHKQEWTNAEAQFRAVLKVYPKMAQAHEALADALKGQGRAAEAQEQLSQIPQKAVP